MKTSTTGCELSYMMRWEFSTSLWTPDYGWPATRQAEKTTLAGTESKRSLHNRDKLSHRTIAHNTHPSQTACTIALDNRAPLSKITLVADPPDISEHNRRPQTRASCQCMSIYIYKSICVYLYTTQVVYVPVLIY